MKIKCFTYDLLIKYSRPDQSKMIMLLKLLNIDKEALYPVTTHMLHNDVEVRCVVVINKSGEELLVTLPIDEFNKLPTEEIPNELLE